MNCYRKLRRVFAIAILLLAVTSAAPAFAADGVVNVNQADEGELMLLPRIGPALAQRILTFREENGKFKAEEDLMLVRGIGEKTFALLGPYVTVEGETTLGHKVRTSEAQARLDAEQEKPES